MRKALMAVSVVILALVVGLVGRDRKKGSTAGEIYLKRIEDGEAKIRLMLTPTKRIKDGLVTKVTKHRFPVTSGRKSIAEFPISVAEVRDPKNPEEEIRLVCPNESSFEEGRIYATIGYVPDNNGKITYGEIIALGTQPSFITDGLEIIGIRYDVSPVQEGFVRGNGIVTPIALKEMDVGRPSKNSRATTQLSP